MQHDVTKSLVTGVCIPAIETSSQGMVSYYRQLVCIYDFVVFISL